MYDFIPLSQPVIRGKEWEYIKDCLDTEWVSTAGSYVNKFEKEICSYTGSKYAVACSSGTAALHIALKICGIGNGDEVIAPCLTFIAPINAIAYNNSNPVFMDADRYFNIDIDKTIDFINKNTIFKNGNTYNKDTNNKISGILPVHVWGNAAGLNHLVALCRKRNILIIEDASESLGTRYKKEVLNGKHTGTIGKVGCFSFNGNKIITAGSGGMIVTDDYDLAQNAIYLTTQAKDDPLHYIHNDIGYNYRMSNLQAALGLAQLEQIRFYLKEKNTIHKKYLTLLEKIEGLSINPGPKYATNNYWLNLLNINKDIYGKNNLEIMKVLRKSNIETRPVWSLNHKQKPYKNYQSYMIDNAPDLISNSLCLPSSSNLNTNQIDFIVSKLID
jgi:perosamine synthetase